MDTPGSGRLPAPSESCDGGCCFAAGGVCPSPTREPVPCAGEDCFAIGRWMSVLWQSGGVGEHELVGHGGGTTAILERIAAGKAGVVDIEGPLAIRMGSRRPATHYER